MLFFYCWHVIIYSYLLINKIFWQPKLDKGASCSNSLQILIFTSSILLLKKPLGPHRENKVCWSDLAQKRNPTTGEVPLMTHTANNVKSWKDCVVVPLHYPELSLFPWFYISSWFFTPGTNSQIVLTEVIHAWLLVKFSTNTIFTRFQDVFMSQNQTRLIFSNDLKRV